MYSVTGLHYRCQLVMKPIEVLQYFLLGSKLDLLMAIKAEQAAQIYSTNHAVKLGVRASQANQRIKHTTLSKDNNENTYFLQQYRTCIDCGWPGTYAGAICVYGDPV